MADFPDVPDLPGVPALLRAPGIAAIETVVLLIADALGLLIPSQQEWGLFLDGEPVVTAESVVSFEFKQGYTVATFAIEPNDQSPGTFESYDKVQHPFDVRLRFTTGGDLSARQELIESCEAACASLDLMDAVTPERTYQSLNPTHMDYRRTAISGVGLLSIDVFCEQIRSTASSTFTSAQSSTSSQGFDTSTSKTDISVRPAASIVSPQSPSASPQIDGGTVQPVSNAPGQFDLSQALP